MNERLQELLVIKVVIKVVSERDIAPVSDVVVLRCIRAVGVSSGRFFSVKTDSSQPTSNDSDSGES